MRCCPRESGSEGHSVRSAHRDDRLPEPVGETRAEKSCEHGGERVGNVVKEMNSSSFRWRKGKRTVGCGQPNRRAERMATVVTRELRRSSKNARPPFWSPGRIPQRGDGTGSREGDAPAAIKRASKPKRRMINSAMAGQCGAGEPDTPRCKSFIEAIPGMMSAT